MGLVTLQRDFGLVVLLGPALTLNNLACKAPPGSAFDEAMLMRAMRGAKDIPCSHIFQLVRAVEKSWKRERKEREAGISV